MTLLAVSVQAQKQISYIEETKNWYYVYDEAGEKIGGLSRSSVWDLKGWGNDFFVARYYSFYRIYDAKGKVLKAMNVYHHQPQRQLDIHMEQGRKED